VISWGGSAKGKKSSKELSTSQHRQVRRVTCSLGWGTDSSSADSGSGVHISYGLSDNGGIVAERQGTGTSC